MIRRMLRCRTIICASIVAPVLLVAAAAQGPGKKAQNAPAEMQCPMMTGGQQHMPIHQEMAKLMDDLQKSTAALQKETDQTALKKKLSEHAALIKQLQTKFEQCSQQCSHMMSGAPSAGQHKM